MTSILEKCGVYRIENTITNQFYIGSTSKTFNIRFSTHRWDLRSGRHCNNHLQNSWNKHGEIAFKFEVVEECDPQWAVAQEQVFLDFYSRSGRLYNLCPTAGSMRGRVMPLETREKIRLSKQNISVETRAKISAANRRRGPEVMAKLSFSKRRENLSPETRAKLSETRKNRDPQIDVKVAAFHRGRKRSLETRLKMKLAKANLSPEVKRNLSERMTSMNLNRSPETIAKMAQAARGRKVSVETRNKMRKSQWARNYAQLDGQLQLFADRAD